MSRSWQTVVSRPGSGGGARVGRGSAAFREHSCGGIAEGPLGLRAQACCIALPVSKFESWFG